MSMCIPRSFLVLARPHSLPGAAAVQESRQEAPEDLDDRLIDPCRLSLDARCGGAPNHSPTSPRRTVHPFHGAAYVGPESRRGYR